MARAEVVHAAPEPGMTFSPCCDRTALEIAAGERISNDPAQVTCGTLSALELRLLSGQPETPVAERPLPRPASRGLSAERHSTEQLLFEMALSVRTICGSRVSLQTAFEKVQSATLEVAPSTHSWSAATMVRITSRALELAGS